MIIKVRYVMMLLMVIFFVFSLFQVKFKVQSLHTELAELKKQLEHEKDLIHVLEAEWTYLNQPERLQLLATRLLNLSEIKSEQIIVANYSDSSPTTRQNDTSNVKMVEEKFIKTSMTNTSKNTQIKWRYKERPDLLLRRKK